MIQDHLFSTSYHGNQFYFLVTKFVSFFTLFFLSEKMKGMKKFQSDTKIVHKVANISKYLHLYILTLSKNSVSYLLFLEFDGRINLKSCRQITVIQDNLFSTPFHGNQFYFHVKSDSLLCSF